MDLAGRGAALHGGLLFRKAQNACCWGWRRRSLTEARKGWWLAACCLPSQNTPLWVINCCERKRTNGAFCCESVNGELLEKKSQVLPSKLECERNLLEGDDRNEVKQLFPDPCARCVSHCDELDLRLTRQKKGRGWYYKRLLWWGTGKKNSPRLALFLLAQDGEPFTAQCLELIIPVV